jgi:CubicO group peptidase (beta-lactamase class C family)
MRGGVTLGIVGLLVSVGCGDSTAPATVVDLSGPWTRATPAEAGIDATLLAQAVSVATTASRRRSLLVARHGRLVLEQYFGGADSATRVDVRSVTKSVVSSLVGIAIARGALTGVNATVGSYLGLPDTLDAGDRAVTVGQLLTMTSGYSWNETSGIALTGRDLLRYGQLVLQRGRSGNHQVVPRR